MSESEQFMKNFIEFTLKLKRHQFQSALNKQTNEQKNSKQQVERQPDLGHFIQDEFVGRQDREMLDYYLNTKCNKTSLEFHIILPSQFLLECMFLAILDFNGKSCHITSFFYN